MPIMDTGSHAAPRRRQTSDGGSRIMKRGEDVLIMNAFAQVSDNSAVITFVASAYTTVVSDASVRK